MLEFIQEMIHENNLAPEGLADEKIVEFELKYDAIVQTATKEYEDVHHQIISETDIICICG